MIKSQNNVAARKDITAVSTPLLVWLTCGTAGSLLFATTYLIEGATRPGYNALQQSISALSLGHGGWVQQVNFVVFGLIILSTVFAWHKLLKGGAGATWYPIFRFLEGFGILMDGFFSQDPTFGYPAGTTIVSPTLHGTLHLVFAVMSITAIACGFFVLARRFLGDSRWRGWATYTVITGILIIVFITLFGIANGQQSEIAGVFERLATSFGTLWGLIFLARLWFGTRFMASQRQVAPQIA